MKFVLCLITVLFAGSAFANDALGTYRGKFDGHKGALTLSSGANGYTLSFLGDDGSTDMVAGCNTAIGNAVEVKEKGGMLKSLDFEFNAGSCFDIEGRELNVKVKPGQLSLSIYAHTTSMETCSFDPYGRQYCKTDMWPAYLTGKFTK